MNNVPEPEYVDVETGEIVIKDTNGNGTELTVSQNKFDGMKFVPQDQMPDFESAKRGIAVTPQYYQGFINAGDSVRAVFNGMTTINKKTPDGLVKIPTAVFQNKSGIFIHSGANLVDQLNLVPAGSPIEITYKGKEKTGNGNNINKFEVVLLNV